MIGERARACRVQPLDQSAQPARPVRHPVRGPRSGPERQIGRRREGRPLPPQVQLQIPRPAQVVAAVRAGRRQRVLQQREQRLPGQPPAEEPGHMAQEAPRRRERERLARGIVRHDPPAVERRRHLPREPPVRGDERRAATLLGGLPQDHRHCQRLGPRPRRLDQRHAARGLGKPGEVPALGQPLIGDGRRPERERDQPVARRAGRDLVGPAADLGGACAHEAHQPMKAELRMILGGQRVVHPLPDRGGQVEVEAGQHERALRQPRHRLHEEAGRAARAGRARDDHRVIGRRLGPARRDPLDRHPRQRLRIGRVRAEHRRHDRHEGLRPLPVRRMVGHIEPRDGLGRHALALHLVDELGEAVRQVEERRARRDVGLRLDQPGHELRKLEPAAQRRDRGRQTRHRRQLGHEADARQEARALGRHQVGDPPPHPLRVDVELDPRHRLGRGPCHARAKATHQRCGKVHARGQAEEAGARCVKHWRASPRPRRSLRAAPRRTIRRDGSGHGPCPRRSSRPRPD